MTRPAWLPHVVWIGDRDRAEWFDAADWLTACVVMRNYANVADALAGERRRSAACDEPAVILLTPTRRGQFSPHHVAALRSRFPLTPVVLLVGCWLEGEPRTGRPLPGVIRMPWATAGPRIAAELDRWSRGRRGEWSLPPTAGDDERTLTLLPAPSAPRYGGLVAVIADDTSLAEALLASCHALGAAAVARRAEPPVLATKASLIVWDVPIYRHRAERQADWLATTFGDVPKLAVAGFPRPDDRAYWQARGISAILPKPFALPDLAWHFERVLARPISEVLPPAGANAPRRAAA